LNILEKFFKYKKYLKLFEANINGYHILFNTEPSIFQDSNNKSLIAILNNDQYKVFSLIQTRVYHFTENNQIVFHENNQVKMVNSKKDKFDLQETLDDLKRAFCSVSKIEQKAYNIYLHRLNKNIAGDSLQDWLTAEKECLVEAIKIVDFIIKFLQSNQELVIKTLDDLESKNIIYDYTKYEVSLGEKLLTYSSNIKQDLTLKTAKKSTINIIFHTTDKCNLTCPYCYLDKEREHLSREDGRLYLERIFDITKSYEQIELTYTGGEAFLNYDVLIYLIEYSKNLAQKYNLILKQNIFTNGTLLKEDKIQQIKNIAPDTNFRITLDGIEEIHNKTRYYKNKKGSFKDIENGVKLLKKYKLNFSFTTVINYHNWQYIPELIEYYLQNGYTFTIGLENEYKESLETIRNSKKQCLLNVNMNELVKMMLRAFEIINKYPPQPVSLMDNLFQLSSMSTYTCSGGVNTFAVSEKGSVSACHNSMDMSFGSIFDDDILKIATGNTCGFVYSILERNVCNKCLWGFICRGGCPLLARAVYGSLKAPSPFCQFYKTLLPEAVKMEALRLIRLKENI
jgi:uncharacterized protein